MKKEMKSHAHDSVASKRKAIRDIASMLRSSGLKATPSRLALVAAFPKSCDPVNAEFLINKMSGKPSLSIDQATIYRNLAAFEKARLIKRVDLHKDSGYYELTGAASNDHSHHHHHMICTACGLIEGFDVCTVASITRSALSHSSKFKSIQDHSLELFGICNSCSI